MDVDEQHAGETEGGETAAAAEEEKRDDSFWGVVKEIYEEEGPTGYWLGLGLYLNALLSRLHWQRFRNGIGLDLDRRVPRLGLGGSFDRNRRNRRHLRE